MFPDPGICHRLGKLLVRRSWRNAVAGWLNGCGALGTQSVQIFRTPHSSPLKFWFLGKKRLLKWLLGFLMPKGTTIEIILKGVWKSHFSRLLFIFSQDLRVGSVSEGHLVQTPTLRLNSTNIVSDNGRRGREFVLTVTPLAKKLWFLREAVLNLLYP